MKPNFLRIMRFALPIASAVLSVALAATAAQPGDAWPRSEAKLLGAYFEEWSIYGANYQIADVQNSGAAAKLDHLLYAFANVDTNGHCAIADPWADYGDSNLRSVSGQPYTAPLYGNFGALQQLKQLNPKLKVLISIGGASAANTANFATTAATAQGRQQLASSCIDMFIEGNIAQGVSTGSLFDGIDVNWEFPAAADKQNFTALLTEFRTQLNALRKTNHKNYLLTIAAPAGSQNYSNMQLRAVAQQLDFLNMETYDYHGTWETTTNHAAPLFESPRDPARGQGLNIEATIAAYLKAGVPAKKMLLGIPAYGRGWTGVPNVNYGLYQTSTGPAPSPAGDTLATDGVATFRTLENLTGFSHHLDYFTLAVWLYDPATQTFWSYDNPTSVIYKMAYTDLREGGLGGAFMWALKDDDANAKLLKTMADGLALPLF